MGGISKIDAAVIQTRGDDVRCEVGGPSTRPETLGKYVGWVMLYNGDEFDHPIVSTKPVFDTAEEALACVQDLVKEIRAMPSVWETEIKPILGDHAEPVTAIVEAAR